MYRYRNVLFCFILLGTLIALVHTSTIRRKRVSRSLEPSKTLQTPEEIPTGIESNTNSFKLDVKDFTKKNTFSRIGPSNLHGFQYEVYFPPHQKFNKKSSTEDENIKASGTSEVKSILPPVQELLRNMEIRPSNERDEYQDVKESDTPELVGYFYDPPLTPTESTSCSHNGIEHDTPEEDGYVYETPTIKDPELDGNDDKTLQKAVKDNKVEPVVAQAAQINDAYFPSASNQREIIQAQEKAQKVDPDFPNFSSVKFRSSFFGENGLPRISTDEETDKIPPEYNFAYVIRGENEFGHEESLLDEAARGSYHVLLPDGRLQNIQYEADAGGYRPVISYVQP